MQPLGFKNVKHNYKGDYIDQSGPSRFKVKQEITIEIRDNQHEDRDIEDESKGMADFINGFYYPI